MDFLEWLKEFKEVDRPVGDLARDVLNDPDFPKSNEYAAMHDYLQIHAADVVLETFKKVWKAYKMLI